MRRDHTSPAATTKMGNLLACLLTSLSSAVELGAGGCFEQGHLAADTTAEPRHDIGDLTTDRFGQHDLVGGEHGHVLHAIVRAELGVGTRLPVNARHTVTGRAPDLRVRGIKGYNVRGCGEGALRGHGSNQGGQGDDEFHDDDDGCSGRILGVIKQNTSGRKSEDSHTQHNVPSLCNISDEQFEY